MLMKGPIEATIALKSEPRSGIVSYFFCQSTDSRLENAVSVLRWLLNLLVSQQRTRIQHLRKRYDAAGRPFFEDINSLYALWTILIDIT
jgi:hypothetical protein